MSRIYIRPIGLLWGEDAESAVASGTAGWVAGGPAAFCMAELIVREGTAIEREQRNYGDLQSIKGQADRRTTCPASRRLERRSPEANCPHRP